MSWVGDGRSSGVYQTNNKRSQGQTLDHALAKMAINWFQDVAEQTEKGPGRKAQRLGGAEYKNRELIAGGWAVRKRLKQSTTMARERM